MGSSGGGGGGGEMSWPSYLEEQHEDWLGDLDKGTIPGMIALNPFTLATAYDPTADLGLAWDAVCEFDAFVDGLAHEVDYESAMNKAETVTDEIIDDTYINADINAFADNLDTEMNINVFPVFKSGMREVNAVMSSAFVLGEADIYSRRTKEVVKYGTDLRSKMNLQRNEMVVKGASLMLQNLMTTASYEGEVARVSVDAKRIATVAFKEQNDMDIEIDEFDGRWDNEAYKYGANMLAAISGGTSGTSGSGMSKTQSAIGGALSGAAMGAQVGSVVPGVGSAFGAVAGGLLGLGAALL